MSLYGVFTCRTNLIEYSTDMNQDSDEQIQFGIVTPRRDRDIEIELIFT